ncbi:MAG: cell wall hydrolase [Novosphingobium sp.]
MIYDREAAHQRSDQAVEAELSLKPPPVAEPLVFAAMTPDRARQINAAISFAGIGPPARPFSASGDEGSRARATDCMAAAMWYEAGSDEAGNRSVGQVVLNRLRHPAFPATVCGVVFQGSERRTGCQFTFTCDGALARVPPAAAYQRVRDRAAAMLAGSTEASVGLATHYHTDWVHPIWSAELEKIARVGTHLFFRWKGAWGGPHAQMSHYAGVEPTIPALAFLSPAHRAALPAGEAVPAAVASESAATVATAKVDNSSGLIRVEISPLGNASAQALAAYDLCGDRAFCEIEGRLPGSGVNGPKVFYYIRDRSQKIERALWDCTRFKRPTTTQCLYKSG